MPKIQQAVDATVARDACVQLAALLRTMPSYSAARTRKVERAIARALMSQIATFRGQVDLNSAVALLEVTKSILEQLAASPPPSPEVPFASTPKESA